MYKKIESGRSMIEMLGVLAIVGVLSVGALSGYSMAMERYRAGKAVDEIKDIIFEIQDLYKDEERYAGLFNDTLIKAGILASDAKNVYNLPIVISDGFASPYWIFTIMYDVPSFAACKKILLAGWYGELGEGLRQIGVRGNSNSFTYLNGAQINPVSIDTASTSCVDIKQIIFYVH